MPKPSFYRLMEPDARAQMDSEIRRRGYSDSYGLCTWLAARGVNISKSTIAGYTRQLKHRDELRVPPPFSPESARALVDFAHLALLAKAAFEQFLLTLK